MQSGWPCAESAEFKRSEIPVSIKKMSQVWELDIDHGDAWILMSLSDHAEDDGTGVRPSIRLTAWKTGYTERQVQRIMKGLRDRGVLVLIRPAGQHHPAEYRLDFSSLEKKGEFVKSPHSRGDILTPLESGQAVNKSDPQKLPGVTFETSRGDISGSRGDIAVSPNPSYNPSSEPSIRGGPVDNFESELRPSEELARACVRVCAADREMFAAGPTQIIRWQHEALSALERTEKKEVAHKILLATFSQLETALRERKVRGHWTQYAEAIRKRVRSKILMEEAEGHKKFDPDSIGGIFSSVLRQADKKDRESN